MICEACAHKARNEAPKDSHAAYTQGLAYGVGGAIAGLAIYATFAIATGIVIGYVSLAVGWVVGKAINVGSKGVGGRRYQVTAVLLTYAAVSLAAIPISISQAWGEKAHQKPQQVERIAPPGENQDAVPAVPPVGSSNPPQPNRPASPEKQQANHMSAGAAILELLIIGLASPFLELQDPFQGLIGLVILGVGIRIAWRMTAGNPLAEIVGPFSARATTPTPSGLG